MVTLCTKWRTMVAASTWILEEWKDVKMPLLLNFDRVAQSRSIEMDSLSRYASIHSPAWNLHPVYSRYVNIMLLYTIRNELWGSIMQNVWQSYLHYGGWNVQQYPYSIRDYPCTTWLTKHRWNWSRLVLIFALL